MRVGGNGTRSRPVDLALVHVGVALAIGAGIEVALIVDSGFTPRWVLLLFPAVAAIYGATGLLAWHRRPSNRMGSLIVGGAAAWVLAGLVNTAVEPVVALGYITATVPLAFIVHLLHAFPSGRLADAWSRGVVATAYVISLVLQAPHYLYVEGAPAPYDVLAIDARPDLVALAGRTQNAVGAVVMAATAVLLVRRWRGALASQRLVVAPLSAFGIVSILYFPLSTAVRDALDLDPVRVAASQLAVGALVPIAFTLGVLRGGFARTGEIEELGAWLGSGRGGRPELVQALIETLGDQTLDLVFWVPEREEYVDASGTVVTLPETATGRGSVEVDLAGRRIGAITYDRTLIADAELVQTAGRVVAIAIDRERLTADLRANREALRQTLGRVVEAGDVERRRIAQDLHDGIQAQLVVLGLQARQIESGAGPSPTGAQLGAAIDAAARDLRNLVHGVMPALLIERGLFAATEDLVDRMPVPTRFAAEGSDRDLPQVIESAAYFVVAEALGNAVKHAAARSLSVTVSRWPELLCIAVDDDGRGGAATGAGAGLTGIADRLGVLGGRLRIDSPPGAGTHIRVEVPCGS